MFLKIGNQKFYNNGAKTRTNALKILFLNFVLSIEGSTFTDFSSVSSTSFLISLMHCFVFHLNV